MKHNKRKANLGKPLENPRMEARARKLRVGNLVRLSKHADRGPESVYVWLKDYVGVVTNVRPYGWGYVVNFSFEIPRPNGLFRSLNRDFGFWPDDLELVKR